MQGEVVSVDKKTKKAYTNSDVIKKFIDDDDTLFFQLIYDSITRATNKKQAKVMISLPKNICNVDTRDLRKWDITCVAIPKEKVKNFLK